jgi:methionyl aminopeptidase
VGRFVVHSAPPIPNSPEPTEITLAGEAVVAIEPFATDGHGLVGERGAAEVFRVDPERLDAEDLDPRVVQTLAAFRGLPFARRQLRDLPSGLVEGTLHVLRHRGQLTSYPPLVERSGHKVAQAEHTLYLGLQGTEVLTR